MNSIKKNFFYNALYQSISIIVPLITTPYVSRILGAYNVGEFSYYNTIATYFVMFAMLGINNYGNRNVARVKESKETVSKVFSEIYYLQLILSIISTAIYIILIIAVLKNKVVASLAGLYVLSASIDISWLFFGLEDFKVTALRSSLIKILSTIAIFLFVKTSNQLPLYVSICCGMFLVSNVILWPRLLKHNVKLISRPIKAVMSHLKGVLILFLPLLGVSLYKYMDKLMLGTLVSKIEVGLYESSEKVINVPVSFISALGTVMLPRVTYLMSNGKDQECRKYMRFSIIFAVYLSTAIAFGISAIIESFVPLFYGNGFDKCKELIPLLMTATVFLGIGNVTRTQFLIPGDYDKVFIGSIFAGASVNLVLNYLLIPQFASNGAAFATVISEFVVCIVQVLFIGKYMPIYRYIFDSVPYIIISGLMFALLKYLSFSFKHAIYDITTKIIIGVVFNIVLTYIYIRCVRKKHILTIFREI